MINTTDICCNDISCNGTFSMGGHMIPTVNAAYDLGNADLKVAFCKDVKCNSNKVKLTRVDTVGLVGSYTSMAIGTDNNPVISYLDETNNDLKVAVVGPVLIFE